MKRLLIILLFSIIYFHKSEGQVINIKKAVEEQVIDYNIIGSFDRLQKMDFLDANGQYYGKCMTMSMHSNIDSSVVIYIENGLMLICEDTLTQNMVLSEPAYVKLNPKEIKTFQLYAMCAEIHDGIPNKLTQYRLGNMADSNLIYITESINELLMNNIAGQGAVWAYTDGATEEDLLKYGATNTSIEKTIEILNKSNVVTRLNPILINDSSKVDSKVNRSSEAKYKYHILVNTYYIYLAGAVFLILIGTIIFLLTYLGILK